MREMIKILGILVVLAFMAFSVGPAFGNDEEHSNEVICYTAQDFIDKTHANNTLASKILWLKTGEEINKKIQDFLLNDPALPFYLKDEVGDWNISTESLLYQMPDSRYFFVMFDYDKWCDTGGYKIGAPYYFNKFVEEILELKLKPRGLDL